MATSNTAAPKEGSTVKNTRTAAKRNSKQNEKVAKLEAKVAHLESLLDNIGKTQAVFELDVEGNFQFANPFFLSLVGYSLEELQGQPHRNLVSEQVRNSPEYEQLRTALHQGEVTSGDFEYLAKDGQEIWMKAAYHPIFNQDGELVRILANGINLTQQKYVLKTVAMNAEQLAAASSELSAVSQYMSSSADETSNQSNIVSAAAEEVNRNIEVVTTGTEEMTFSIKEIALNAHEAANVATNAVKAAEKTNQIVSKLGDSSGEIGKVIKVITSIAQQTKLLALNATIEAARAGEAGKGFAVVANEVKELAKETATATEDISQKIEAIQADTQSAVNAIADIQNIINQINDFQNTIASAVEEQAATTSEIGRNVAEAAKGSHEIAKNIAGVAEAARSTSAGASETQLAAAELNQMANNLQDLVKEFGY